MVVRVLMDRFLVMMNGISIKSAIRWYGFDASGWMKTGWAAFDKNWYYFAPSGAMKTGWLAENKIWYYLKSDGKMAKRLA